MAFPYSIALGPGRRLQEKNPRPGESADANRPTEPDTAQRESSDRMCVDRTGRAEAGHKGVERRYVR